jgi:hypothetical protein
MIGNFAPNLDLGCNLSEKLGCSTCRQTPSFQEYLINLELSGGKLREKV